VQRVQAVRDGARGPDVWLVLRWNPETGELKTYLAHEQQWNRKWRYGNISQSRRTPGNILSPGVK
jgi:hypothetical protein